MTEISFRGELTEDLYLRMAQFIWPKMLRATPALIFVGVGILVWRAWPLSLQQPLRLVQIAIAAAIGIAVIQAPKMGARKAFRSDPLLQAVVQGQLTEEGLVWQQGDRGLRLPWSSIIGYRRTDDFLLLYRSPLQFHYVFRQFFDDDEAWRQAVALTEQLAQRR